MKLIYVHLNPLAFDFSKELKTSNFVFNDLPEYAKLSIKQSKSLGYDVELITETSKYNDEINNLYMLCKQGFPSFYQDPFWLLTLLRLYVVAQYARDNNIDNFLHMEYDNLVYYGPEELHYLPFGTYCTPVGPQCGSAGFMYVNNLNTLGLFMRRITEILTKGEQVMRQHTQYGQLSEMIMIDLIHAHTKDLKYLPLLPPCEYGGKYVFDGASYGQYLGGTNAGNNKGWHGMHHYVGQNIHYKQITKIFTQDGKPYVEYRGTTLPIFNLHIHSKKLSEFTYEQPI